MEVELSAAFVAQAERVGAVVQRVDGGEVASSVTRVLHARGCRSVALAAALPERQTLMRAVAAGDLAVVAPETLWPTRRADAGVSWARLGVAETGSVLLHSSAEDRRVELCVDVHLVLLPATALVATLDAALETIRAISAAGPAYASLISGPSRSADIERTLTIGIHGPRELHILLLETP